MKKIMFFFLFILSFQFILADAGELRIGVDVTTDYDMNDGSKEIGYGGKVEVVKDFGGVLELGIGFGQQVFGEVIEYWGGNLENTIDTAVFSATPLYGIIKLKLGNEEYFMPYIKANVGYAFEGETENEGDFDELADTGGGTENLELTPSSGLYYGIGFGIVIRNFLLELIYEVNKMDVDMKNIDTAEKRTYAEEFSRITFEIGYRFNLEGGFGSAVTFGPPE